MMEGIRNLNVHKQVNLHDSKGSENEKNRIKAKTNKAEKRQTDRRNCKMLECSDIGLCFQFNTTCQSNPL